MLRIDQLNISYGPVRAVNGVSLDLGSGEVKSLVGVNGAGKTSILKAIMGIIRPASGLIEFNSIKLNGKSTNQIIALGIGVVPEGKQVFSTMTVRDNLLAGAFLVRDKRKVAERLTVLSDILPRLRERMSQYAGSLSGGEQQMLAIARALMSSPKLLLMDEPSAGLAPIIVDEVYDLIDQIRKEGTSILLVEQNVERVFSVSDWVYVLELGQTIIEGKSVDLVNDPRMQSAYLGL